MVSKYGIPVLQLAGRRGENSYGEQAIRGGRSATFLTEAQITLGKFLEVRQSEHPIGKMTSSHPSLAGSRT
eukprot:Pgem_evm1s7093